jgi:hypothetical protein
MSHYIVEGGPFAFAFEAMPREYLLPWTCWEPQGNGAAKDKKPRASKLKYTCPSCSANAWGKPGLSLRCGNCNEAMVSEGDDDDERDAGQSALKAA